MTLYQRHTTKWKQCKRCPLCKTRKKVVIARGVVPCDILFCGEAPGASEDVIGQPFVGPAGHLLDKIIEKSVPLQESYFCSGTGNHLPYCGGTCGVEKYGVSVCLTNLVACIPKNSEEKGEPPEESIRECSPRLQDFINNIAQPKMIVCVGKLSWEWCPRVAGVRYIQIVHPAAILRADVSQRGLLLQKCIVTLSDAIQDL